MGSTDAPPDGRHHPAEVPPPRTDARRDGPVDDVGVAPKPGDAVTEAAHVAR